MAKQQSEKVVLSNKQAHDFRFKSFIDRPMSELSELQRSLLLAECSMMSYLPIEQCNIAAGLLGFVDGKYFDCGNAQAYWFQTDYDSVVVFRGTEPNEWDDIRADANALTALAETIGKVHRGFKMEVDKLWPYIEDALVDDRKPLWMTGHSLGGAMATICTGRCLVSHIRSEPSELHTFGSPRVGCKRYVNFSKIPHFRWVNNNDIVTTVPPSWMGYRHSGQERYINRHGRVVDIKGWKRFSDGLQSFLKGLLRLRIDHLADHSVLNYIDIIFEILRAQGSGPARRSSNSEQPIQVSTDESSSESENEFEKQSEPAGEPASADQ